MRNAGFALQVDYIRECIISYAYRQARISKTFEFYYSKQIDFI